MMKHQEKHPDYVEGCFGCKAASLVGVTFGPNGREDFHENVQGIHGEQNTIRTARERGMTIERV